MTTPPANSTVEPMIPHFSANTLTKFRVCTGFPQDSRASYDYIHYNGNPTPDSVGVGEKPLNHGTACAGIVAMAKDNSQCGVGVAYDCNIGGLLSIDCLLTISQFVQYSQTG